MKRSTFLLAISAVLATPLILIKAQDSKKADMEKDKKPAEAGAKAPANTELATFGAGCFWCTEACLEKLDGVLDVSSGYMGGHVKNPTYEQVCQKDTGHVEVVQVKFDPAKVSYDKLLSYFWKLHDPTSMDQQGADRGPQYRSVIFYHSEDQKKKAEAQKKKLEEAKVFDKPVVTEIREASAYYVAEDHHQDFYRNNKTYGYCRVVIKPKLDKLGLSD